MYIHMCTYDAVITGHLGQGMRESDGMAGLHLEFLMSSHIGTDVNALEAGNMGMPQLSLLH